MSLDALPPMFSSLVSKRATPDTSDSLSEILLPAGLGQSWPEPVGSRAEAPRARLSWLSMRPGAELTLSSEDLSGDLHVEQRAQPPLCVPLRGMCSLDPFSGYLYLHPHRAEAAALAGESTEWRAPGGM